MHSCICEPAALYLLALIDRHDDVTGSQPIYTCHLSYVHLKLPEEDLLVETLLCHIKF